MTGGSLETGSGAGLRPACSCHPRALLGSSASSPSHRHPGQGSIPQRREPGLSRPSEAEPVYSHCRGGGGGGAGSATEAQEVPISPEERLSRPELRHPQETLSIGFIPSEFICSSLTLSVPFQACILGEVMSSCNAESLERPFSHFSQHCLFQSRKQSQ